MVRTLQTEQRGDPAVAAIALKGGFMAVQCWLCDYFQPADPAVDFSGWCRRHPPRGIDEKTNPTPGNPLDVWPPVKDGKIEQCGEFKQSTGI